MKLIRYSVFGLLAIVAIVIVALAIFILTFDPKQYKGDIERLVQQHTNRTLVLSDDIQMSVYPKLGVRIGPTRLTERDNKTTFVSVESAQVSIALMPLLKRQVQVEGINLSGLVANVVRDKNGHFNFDDLTGAQDKTKRIEPIELSSSTGDATQIVLDVASIHLEKGTITYLDQASNERLTIQDLNLHTGQLAIQSAGDLKISAQIQAPSAPLDARVDLSGRYVLNVPDKTYALRDAALSLNGYAFKLQNLTLSARSSVQANLGTSRFDFQGIDISASVKDQIKASIRSAGLILNSNAMTVQQLDISASVNQPKQKVGLQFQAPEVSGNLESITIEKFTSTLQLDLAEVLAKPLRVPLQGNLAVDLVRQNLRSTVTASIEDSKINASLSLPRFDPMAYRANIKIDQLDLNRYLSSGTGQASPEKAPAGQPVKSASASTPAQPTRIDLSAIQDLDLQAIIEIGKLKAGAMTLESVKTDVQASKGQLRIGPHSARVGGGTIQGDASVNARTNQFHIKETLSKINVDTLAKEMGQDSRVEGQANVVLDLTSRGETVDQLRQNLAGKGNFNIANGAIRGVDIERLLQSIQNVFKGGALPAFSSSDRTVFSDVSGSFTVTQGVATNKDLSITAPVFRVQGQGEINLVTEQLNYLARLSVVDTRQAQASGELDALRGITIPVRLTGPVSNLSYQLDMTSIAAELAKSQANKALSGKLGEVLGPERTEQVEKLLGPDVTQRLKGLFGR